MKMTTCDHCSATLPKSSIGGVDSWLELAVHHGNSEFGHDNCPPRDAHFCDLGCLGAWMAGRVNVFTGKPYMPPAATEGA